MNRRLRNILIAVALMIGVGSVKANACDYSNYHVAIFGGHIWWASVCIVNEYPAYTSYYLVY